MERFIWESGDFSIEYANPRIQEMDSSREVKTFKDVLHFYYDVTVRVRGAVVMTAQAFDFPLVQHVARAVEDIIMRPVDSGSVAMRGLDGKPTVYHNVVDMFDPFYNAAEYGMKFERTYIFGEDGYTDSTFSFTIGKTPFNRETQSYSNVGEMFTVFDLSDRDLMGLSNVTTAFCDYAIKEHENDDYEEEEIS